MTEIQSLNHFSMLSRLFGNLFARNPQDNILAPVFNYLQQQGLSQLWVLETDTLSQQALENVQLPIALDLLAQEYDKLFVHNPKVSNLLSDYSIDEKAFHQFRLERAMPRLESAVNFGQVLLTASWLEDNTASPLAQHALFEQFLLPFAHKFLTQVETNASLPFYRSLAYLTRELLSAMADELEEIQEA